MPWSINSIEKYVSRRQQPMPDSLMSLKQSNSSTMRMRGLHFKCSLMTCNSMIRSMLLRITCRNWNRPKRKRRMSINWLIISGESLKEWPVNWTRKTVSFTMTISTNFSKMNHPNMINKKEAVKIWRKCSQRCLKSWKRKRRARIKLKSRS